jgi:hypothetical protein
MAIERKSKEQGRVPASEIVRLLKWRDKPSFWMKAATVMKKYKVDKNYVNGLLKEPLHGKT